jgi:Ca2+:H+ antiporter
MQSTPRVAARKASITTPRDPSAAMSYAPSEVDTSSVMSASEYSSGDEEGDRGATSGTGNRTGTLRGRPMLGDRHVLVSQSSNISKAASGTGSNAAANLSGGAGTGSKGKRRPSMPARGVTNQSDRDRDRSKARRGSVAARGGDYEEEDEEDGRFGPLDDEDDEVHPQDRGEELVRRRMKARARERRLKRKRKSNSRCNWPVYNPSKARAAVNH